MANYSAMSTSFNPLSVITIFLSISSLVLCRHHTSASVDVGRGESHDPERLQTYIVRVQPPAGVVDAGPTELESWYKSFLSESSSNMNESRLLHSYSEVFVGFAAKLTQTELKSMQKREEFVHAFPDQELRLLTTHTPAFLDLHMGRGLWNASALGRGVIIGLLDSGITPTHPSFSDDGLPPPPARWKGKCDFDFGDGGCNNKLIGARTIVKNAGPPFDYLGHGTHTAGTAAGNLVHGASEYGQASGTAAGIAPHAHVAMYMVCLVYICSSADMLAGFDAAVKDGVDVISVSLGRFGAVSNPFYMDAIAIGAFGAAEKGIIVSCAAGNDGPSSHSLSNEAPWYITVGATSVDRSFRASVRLGNGRVYEGESSNQQFSNFSSTPFPLAYSSNFSKCTDFLGFNITGKIVVCGPGVSAPSSDIAKAVKKADGAGTLIVNSREDGYSVAVEDFALPASQLSAADGAAVIAYASNAENNPKASIVFNGTILGTSPAPVVASFSSRGPSNQSMTLKPDISAPGLNILAAWPAHVIGQERYVVKNFSIASGTSMATPHVSGIAALIKSVHPDWSPAAVKSAIITTSDAEGRNGESILDERHQKASFFAKGAGQVNPSKAVDPGLVYDVSVDDYIGYICKIYGDKGARIIVRSHNVSCSKVKQKSAEELNLPSILAPLVSKKPWTTTRVVTNVGKAKSTYTAQVDIPNEAVTIQVTPPTLRFAALGEKKTFDVTVKQTAGSPLSGTVEGNLRWISDGHVVRSPIVVLFSLPL